jgi:hypothetical protein
MHLNLPNVELKQWQKEEQKSQRTEHPQIAEETQKIGSFCERSSKVLEFWSGQTACGTARFQKTLQ